MPLRERSTKPPAPAENRAHRLFYLPEMLEAILLNLDMHTLLMSARVCYTWNDLIKNSRKIQQALFYIPVDPLAPGQRSVKNPLVVKKIWFDFIRRRIAACTRPAGFICMRQMPPVTEELERVYSRPEASWRRMLLQQPPNSTLYFWNPEDPNIPYTHVPKKIYTHAKWAPNGDYIRMEHVAHCVDTGVFSPGPLPFLCWINPHVMSDQKPRKRLRKDPVVAQCLAKFDLTMNSEFYFWGAWVPDPNDPDPVGQMWFYQWCEQRDVTLLKGEPLAL